MTYKICYWDSSLGMQMERDATEDEAAEITGRINRAASLIDSKAEKNNLINQWRLQANQSWFMFEGKPIGCDPLSRSDIDGVAGSIALLGTFPDNFPMAWKCLDNTFLSLPDVGAFKAMYAAMTAAGTATFEYSQQLKTALAEATTKAQVDAIEWNLNG